MTLNQVIMRIQRDMFITEIIGRCEQDQGVLRPFICRLEDGSIYFAKGSNSGWSGLIKEWVASNLANEFGLPTPDRCIAYLDAAIKPLLPDDWRTHLDFEHLFASRSVAPCDTLTLSDVKHIPPDLQRHVFMFDYWIDNNDRNLGECGGNVNLLFQPGKQAMYVIDFNLAFEEHCTPSLMETHVFRSSIVNLPVDIADRSWYLDKFDQCLSKLDLFISTIPDEWIECSSSSEALIEDIKKRLLRYNDDDFWGALI